MISRYVSLAVFLLLVIAASLAGSSFEAGEWYYVTMKQPTMAPPGWLYAVTWAVVYVLMALAAWRVWLSQHPARSAALAWWILLLLLNTGWSMLFFGLNRTGWALPLVVMATGTGVLCVRAFSRVSSQATWLMTPYLAWILFILVFNLAVWTINGGALARFLN